MCLIDQINDESDPANSHGRIAGAPDPIRSLRYGGDMAASRSPLETSSRAYRSRARQWSRAAWTMALLLGSLPVASRLFLGGWGFDGAAGMACLCMFAGTYFQIVSRRRFPSVRDPAAMLDQAIHLASSDRTEQAIALLTEAIRLSPWLWQAFQYRGELYLQREDSVHAALRDFDEAVRLAPGEPHLYTLRGQAHFLLGDTLSSQEDYQTAAALAGNPTRRVE
jgi:tetratricopeptide (TPR) repeat protein